jgi:PAS domain S-box-containing protein
MNNAKSTPGTFTPTNDWLYQHIVEDSRVAVIYGDAAGIVRLWNKGAEEIFDWTAEEALGRSMDLIIPEKHRASHWEGYYRVMKTGVTKYGRNVLAVPALTKGGRRVSIEFKCRAAEGAERRGSRHRCHSPGRHRALGT